MLPARLHSCPHAGEACSFAASRISHAPIARACVQHDPRGSVLDVVRLLHVPDVVTACIGARTRHSAVKRAQCALRWIVGWEGSGRLLFLRAARAVYAMMVLLSVSSG